MDRAFTFRAQPALDLRKREFDARRRTLATAEWDFRAARQLLDDAVQGLTAAHQQARDTLDGAPLEQFIWHRVWIARLERSKAAHGVSVAQKQEDLSRAAAACQQARQRVEAMERLKQKAYDAWEHALRLREQREIDALATMRYVAASRALMARSTS